MELGARYHPDREQLALIAEATAPLEELLPYSRLHGCCEETDSTWHALAELGLFGIAIREELGGSGLGTTEEALVAHAFGRRLAAPGVIAAMGALPALASSGNAANTRITRVAAGYQNGKRLIKVHEPNADLLLLHRSCEAELHNKVLSAPLKNGLWLAELHEVISVGEPLASFRGKDFLRLRLLYAAALAGVAAAALEMAVGYARSREQFGRPIGSFQAVKHHCANMAVHARRAADQTCFAAIAFDDNRYDTEVQVDNALLTAGGAALSNAGLNIQIHGGMGFSDEADPHLLLKRAQVYIHIAGGLEAATERIADGKAVW